MDGIYRGSTPLFRVNIGSDPTELESMDFAIKQRGVELIHKTEDDLNVDGTYVQYRLTQEETFLLDPHWNGEAQFRGRKSADDVVVLTALRRFAVYDSANDRVV